MLVARQTELFNDPREARVLPQAGWPFWTLNTISPAGRMEQSPYRLRDMEWILSRLNPYRDTYMSQGFFSRPCRRALHLAWLTHAYVDLDLYKLPNPPSAREAASQLRQFCAGEGIPEPSMIIFSGRGLYVKWAWTDPIPRAAAGRAVAVNKALVRKFDRWGADPAAVDVSRILRVVGTMNTKSGEAAELLYQAERDGEVLTHNFDTFADAVLPFTLQQVRDFRSAASVRSAEVHVLGHERARREAADETAEAGKRGSRVFSPEDWHWGVVEDIRKLAHLRSPDGVVQPGSRATFGHFAACQLARVISPSGLWHEIQALSRIILPADYTNSEFYRHCSTLLERAKRHAAGETETFRGRQVTPVYTYRRSTLIERLEITSAEMPHMTRLIDADEKRRRAREVHRASHTGLDRDRWLAGHTVEKTRPWEAKGISRRTWYRRRSQEEPVAQVSPTSTSA